MPNSVSSSGKLIHEAGVKVALVVFGETPAQGVDINTAKFHALYLEKILVNLYLS